MRPWVKLWEQCPARDKYSIHKSNHSFSQHLWEFMTVTPQRVGVRNNRLHSSSAWNRVSAQIKVYYQNIKEKKFTKYWCRAWSPFSNMQRDGGGNTGLLSLLPLHLWCCSRKPWIPNNKFHPGMLEYFAGGWEAFKAQNKEFPNGILGTSTSCAGFWPSFRTQVSWNGGLNP